jgi:hypothetical protein
MQNWTREETGESWRSRILKSGFVLLKREKWDANNGSDEQERCGFVLSFLFGEMKSETRWKKLGQITPGSYTNGFDTYTYDF